MPSWRRRIQSQVRSAIDSVVREVSETSLHVRYFHREVSDLWRRDDRMLKKGERRIERENAAFAAQEAESASQRSATAAARLSRSMIQGGTLGGGPLSEGRGAQRINSIMSLSGYNSTAGRTLGGGVG